ncbi:MAG: PASTA domain-containing protein, partial [Marmoricola sp.]
PPGRPPPGPRPGTPRRRRGPLLLAAALVVALLLGVGAWWFGIARYTTTPGVINLSVATAHAKAHRAGLDLRVSQRAYSETVVRGAVISTDPAPGSRVLDHGTVDAVVSRGPERHKVPDVRGLRPDQARQAISARHLAFGREIGHYSPKVPQGVVIRTDPAIGSEQRRDTAVDVVTSRGPRPIPVPDLTGQKADRAVQRLGRLGFTVETGRRRFSDAVPAGDVISQSPDSGTGHRGDRVTLVVSRGPHLVRVPDLVRRSEQDARRILAKMGLRVAEHQLPFSIGLGRVARMSPSPGSRVPKGSTVTLGLV